MPGTVLTVNSMRVLTWNCNMAYRQKHSYLIDQYDPDIWIIQECEHPERFTKEKGMITPENWIWYGDNPSKGIGIFAKKEYHLTLDPSHNREYRYVIPVNVSGACILTIYAIWAMDEKPPKRKQRYIGQVYSAVNFYTLSQIRDTLLIGDFNWNLSFDRHTMSGGLTGTFSDFISIMEPLEYESGFHSFHGEKFGEESVPTLYLLKNEGKPFHIDYIFGSRDLIATLRTVQIGSLIEWCKMSDHMPVMMEFT